MVCLSNIESNFSSTTDKTDFKTIINVISSNCSAYVASELAKYDQSEANHPINVNTFIAYFIKELFEAKVISHWLLTHTYPACYFQLKYLENLCNPRVDTSVVKSVKIGHKKLDSQTDMIVTGIFGKVMNAYATTDIRNTKKLSKLNNFVRDFADKYNYQNILMIQKASKAKIEYYTEQVIERLKQYKMVKVANDDTISWNDKVVHNYTS